MIFGETMTYTEITLRKFLDFLKYEKLTYSLTSTSRDTKEYVFDIPASLGTVIRVFSSVDVRSKVSRDRGTDAIRLVLINKELDVPIVKGKKTLRTYNWESILSKKIRHFLEHIRHYERNCPKCHSPLAVRKGKKGEFWGCTAFPKCKYTTNYNEPGKDPVKKSHQEWIFELKASELKGSVKCPACQRGNQIKSKGVYIGKKLVHTDLVCKNCGTKGKLINDI